MQSLQPVWHEDNPLQLELCMACNLQGCILSRGQPKFQTAVQPNFRQIALSSCCVAWPPVLSIAPHFRLITVPQTGHAFSCSHKNK